VVVFYLEVDIFLGGKEKKRKGKKRMKIDVYLGVKKSGAGEKLEKFREGL